MALVIQSAENRKKLVVDEMRYVPLSDLSLTDSTPFEDAMVFALLKADRSKSRLRMYL